MGSWANVADNATCRRANGFADGGKYNVERVMRLEARTILFPNHHHGRLGLDAVTRACALQRLQYTATIGLLGFLTARRRI